MPSASDQTAKDLAAEIIARINSLPSHETECVRAARSEVGEAELQRCQRIRQLRGCECAREFAAGALLGIEGAHALEGDLARLDAFARRSESF